MAQSFCRPLSLVAACRTRTAVRPPQRCFSQSLRLPAMREGMKIPQARQKSEPSLHSPAMQKNGPPNEDIDVGLLPGTYVPHPFFRKLSPPESIFHYFKVQTVRRAWLSFSAFRIVLYAYYSSPTKKPDLGFFKSIFAHRPYTIRPKNMVKVAKDLHTKMYKGLAKRDSSTVKRICATGLADSLRAKMASLPESEHMTWELLRYNRPRAKVVSHRSAPYPGHDGVVIRQAIVRIASTQRLTRKNSSRRNLGGSGEAKHVVEYVCIQTVSRNWKEGPWRLWGTVEPTSEKAVSLMKKDGQIPSWV